MKRSTQTTHKKGMFCWRSCTLNDTFFLFIFFVRFRCSEIVFSVNTEIRKISCSILFVFFCFLLKIPPFVFFLRLKEDRATCSHAFFSSSCFTANFTRNAEKQKKIHVHHWQNDITWIPSRFSPQRECSSNGD